MQFISKSGWLNSTRLNYGLMWLGVISLFLGFNFNFNKLFEVYSTSYFTSLNISFPQIIIILVAFVILLKSGSKILLLNLFIVVQCLTFVLVYNTDKTTQGLITFGVRFILTWSVLFVWVSLISEISNYLKNKTLGNASIFELYKDKQNYKNEDYGTEKKLLIYAFLFIIIYFSIDYLNFLLPIPLLFLFVYWSWLKSTKTLNIVYNLLLTFLILNALVAFYQVLTGQFLGLNWLGENFQTTELARQNIELFGFKNSILRGYGLLPHPNNLSMLGIVSLFCCSLYSLKNRIVTNKIFIVTSILLVLLSFSRVGLFLLVIFYITKFNWKANFNYIKKIFSKFIFKSPFKILFVMLSLVLSALLFINTFIIIWLGRISSDFYRLEEFIWWKDTFARVPIQQILFGSGLGSPPFVLKIYSPELYTWAFQPAHFGLINFIVEFGVIPILIILAYIILKITLQKNYLDYTTNNNSCNSRTIWVTSFGKISNEDRFTEVAETIQANINLNIFNKIYLFSEDSKTLSKMQRSLKSIVNEINFINTKNNLNIQEMYTCIKTTNPKDIIILSNSDIQFNNNFKDQLNYLKPNYFWAITRYQNLELYKEGRLNKLSQLYSTSQDVWVSYSKNWTFQKDLNLGRVAVDNCLAFFAFKSGLKVSNPCLDIVCTHNHKQNNQDWKNMKEYHGWRAFLSPTTLLNKENMPDMEIIWH